MTEREEIEPKPGACEICSEDSDTLNIIPLKQPDGSLITLACNRCAVESGKFCTIHQRPHMGFEDETSACILCIEEEVRKKGTKIAVAFMTGVHQSPKCSEILEAMDKYVDRTIEITGASETYCIARPIVTAAQRLKKSPDEVLQETFEKGPGVLFPWSGQK